MVKSKEKRISPSELVPHLTPNVTETTLHRGPWEAWERRGAKSPVSWPKGNGAAKASLKSVHPPHPQSRWLTGFYFRLCAHKMPVGALPPSVCFSGLLSLRCFPLTLKSLGTQTGTGFSCTALVYHVLFYIMHMLHHFCSALQADLKSCIPHF